MSQFEIGDTVIVVGNGPSTHSSKDRIKHYFLIGAEVTVVGIDHLRDEKPWVDCRGLNSGGSEINQCVSPQHLKPLAVDEASIQAAITSILEGRP